MTVRERPILFSAPMVRAILDGNKTQTRRLKGLDIVNFSADYPSVGWLFQRFVESARALFHYHESSRWTGRWWQVACPYGVVGDRLWVRETWAHFGGDEYLYQQNRGAVQYRADGRERGCDLERSGWRPSIHMPRWASRITLEITDVRVQRLTEISEEDARAEGCVRGDEHKHIQLQCRDADTGVIAPWSARDDFQVLWDSINAKRAPWDSNPWVWAITFQRVAI